jgi:hypothetical protein
MGLLIKNIYIYIYIYIEVREGFKSITKISTVRVDHVMESRGVMNIHVVEHSILNGIEYYTFWFRSVVEMTRHQLLLQVYIVKSPEKRKVEERSRVGGDVGGESALPKVL